MSNDDHRQHALYRFYDTDGHLLYVGVTLDPSARWKTHSKDKPWWLDVANITVELYPSRSTVIDAERAAIIAERPRYNIVHNHGRPDGTTIPTAQLDRLLPIQVGDWAALGLKDGRCPVGGVMAIDATWVSLRLKSFLHGGLMNQIEMIRWDTIERVELAYPEDAEEGHFGSEMDDQHLGQFQTAWERAHFGKDGRDPVDQARREYRAENLAQKERRARP